MADMEIRPPSGSRKKKRISGRGPAGRRGATAGKGDKGQNARSGGGVRPGFEGGQMPLYRRLPKRGFKNPFKRIHAILNLRDLDTFDEGAIIDADTLKKAGMVKGRFDQIKVLGKGELNKKLVLKDILVSVSARQKIESLGGSIS